MFVAYNSSENSVHFDGLVVLCRLPATRRHTRESSPVFILIALT